MNKKIHGIILLLFGAACWFAALILRLPEMASRGRALPAFTRLCMVLGPFVCAGLAIAAAGYCIWVWTRKSEERASWVGFLATAVAALGFVMLPILVAIYLPLVDALNQLASK